MVKNGLHAFIIAFQFLTRLPLPISVPYHPSLVSLSVLFYPLIGLVIGLLLYIAALLLPLGLAPLNAAVILAIWVGVTGGLHMDGLMDTADGLGSHRDRARTLEIMKDSRVGAMGVLAAIFLLLFKWTALWLLLQHSIIAPLLIAPITSRWWMAVAIYQYPYVGGDNGLGRFFRETGKKTLLGTTAFAGLFIAIVAWNYGGGWMIAPQIIAGWLATRGISRKLEGLTGDTYGALNEMIETVGLIAAVYMAMGMRG